MGFQWSEAIGSDIAVKRSHIDEIKNNVNALYSDLQLSPYSWQPASEFVTAGEWMDIRSAVDYADDMNYCRAHDSTKYDTYRSDENGTYYNNDDSGVKSTADSGYNSSDYGGNYSAHDSPVYSYEDGTYDSSDKSGNWTSNCTGFYTYDEVVVY